MLRFWFLRRNANIERRWHLVYFSGRYLDLVHALGNLVEIEYLLKQVLNLSVSAFESVVSPRLCGSDLQQRRLPARGGQFLESVAMV